VNETDITNPVTAYTFFYTNRSGVWAKETVTGFLDSSGIAGAASSVTAILDLTSGGDLAGAAFNCSLGNSTDNSVSGTPVEDITFDSTGPVISLFVDLAGDSQSFGRLLKYSCTTADAVDGTPTEVFAVAHPSEDSPSSTSLTLQSVSLDFLDTDYPGDFVFTCTSTDYTGNIGTISKTVTVDSLGAVKVVKTTSDNNNTLWIVLLLVLVWLIWNAKKK